MHTTRTRTPPLMLLFGTLAAGLLLAAVAVSADHTEIMDGFVDAADDSRDGRLDDGAEAFSFDGVLDVGQVNRDGEAVDLGVGGAIEQPAASTVDGGADDVNVGAWNEVPKEYDILAAFAEGVRDTSDMYNNGGVEGRPEW